MTDVRSMGRAARFADRIRRRAAVRARVPGRVEQVLRAPWRPRPRAARRRPAASTAPTTIQVGLRVDVHAAARRAEVPRELRLFTRRERVVVREARTPATTVPAVLVRPSGAPARPGRGRADTHHVRRVGRSGQFAGRQRAAPTRRRPAVRPAGEPAVRAAGRPAAGSGRSGEQPGRGHPAVRPTTGPATPPPTPPVASLP